MCEVPAYDLCMANTAYYSVGDQSPLCPSYGTSVEPPYLEGQLP